MARSRPVRLPDQELSEPYRGDRSEVSAAMTVFLGAIVALAAFIWFGASAEGARGMLTAIATSMITVAGVTFSITIVALAQASNQFTPRILRNFMRDRANQFVLGVFAGIFAYCLVVLRTVRGGEEAFIPSFSINVGLLMALAGVAVLIFFIHHIAMSLQASYIIASVAEVRRPSECFGSARPSSSKKTCESSRS